ncbi:TPA: hypothetical protein U2M35_002905 [Providencia rettgeri]|nr:hypothetical protein [Providencia rettgeri]
MEFKHSPAPWHLRDGINEDSLLLDDNYNVVALLSTEIKREDENLIEAAPELLEALIELVQSYDKCSIDHNGLCQEHFLQEANDCTFKKANLAIAKALGQQ